MDGNSFLIQLGIDISKLENGLNKSIFSIEGFKESVNDLAKSLVAAFAVEKVADFAYEVSELAAKAHGVKDAFAELPQSNALLEQLRQTTHETVSDLKLMGFAIHAQNLNIPLRDLGELLEFAHLRAIQTNGDFNSLANTLITAIGKGGSAAKRSMAELQVTADDYTKALKENGNVTDAVMSLAREAIEKTNGKMDETLHAIESNSAAWENTKVRIGEVINSSGLLAKSLEYLNLLLSHFGADADKPLTKLQDANLGLRAALDFYNQDQKKGIDLLFAATQQAEKYGFAVKEISDASGKLIQIYAEEKARIEDTSKSKENEKEIIKNISYYENEIKELRERESELVGQELSDTQRQIELESQKLELLKNQFALERDRANSAQLSKMGRDDMSVSGLGTASIGLPPAHDIDKVTASVKAAKQALDDMLIKSAGNYSQGWKSIFDIERIQLFNQTLRNGINSMIVSLAEGLGELAAGVSGSDQIFKALLGSVGSMAIELGQLAIATGIGIEAIKSALESLNGVAAIAAGVALVALGAAVKGAASKIGSGGSGGSSYARPSLNSGGSLKDTSPVMVGGKILISGQDLWVVLSNYQTNNKFTKFG